jgi:hypothetical protein
MLILSNLKMERPESREGGLRDYLRSSLDSLKSKDIERKKENSMK